MSNTNSHLEPSSIYIYIYTLSFFGLFLMWSALKTAPLHDVGAPGSSCCHVSRVRVSLVSDWQFSCPNLRRIRSSLNSLLLPCVWLQVLGRRWSETRRRSALRGPFELKWVWIYARAKRMRKGRKKSAPVSRAEVRAN